MDDDADRDAGLMLNPVPRDKLEALWPWILKGLEEVEAKHDLDWSFEELRSALVLNKAVLYTWGEDEGFCVLQRAEDKNGVVLFVWVLWGPGQHKDCHVEINSDLDGIAKSIGATRVRCRGRLGWSKMGYKVTDTIMERQVW